MHPRIDGNCVSWHPRWLSETLTLNGRVIAVWPHLSARAELDRGLLAAYHASFLRMLPSAPGGPVTSLRPSNQAAVWTFHPQTTPVFSSWVSRVACVNQHGYLPHTLSCLQGSHKLSVFCILLEMGQRSDSNFTMTCDLRPFFTEGWEV